MQECLDSCIKRRGKEAIVFEVFKDLIVGSQRRCTGGQRNSGNFRKWIFNLDHSMGLPTYICREGSRPGKMVHK